MKHYLSILGVFALLTFVFFWQIFLGKVNINDHFLVSFYPIYGQNLAFKANGLDQLRIYYPAYHLIFEEAKQLKIPFWNPYAFSGQPNVADLQSAVFYPLNIFGLFLPLTAFWNFMRFTPTILAAFFMFLFLRSLKISKIASFFGAFSFGFSPFILSWGEEQIITPHTIIWLPLILYSIERGIEAKPGIRGRGKYLVLIGISVAFSIFAGFIQTTFYMALFAALYTLFRAGFGRRREILRIFLALILGTAVGGIQLLPTVELYLLSPRSSVTLRETLNKFLLPPEALLSYFSPDFFGNPATYNFFRRGLAQYYEGIIFVGIAVLVFASFAVFRKKRTKLVNFFVTVFLVTLSTAFDLPTSRLISMLPIPVISSSIAVRILFIPAFCLAVLAAVGMDRWFIEKKRNYKRVLAIFLGVFLLLFLILTLQRFFGIGFPTAVSVTAKNAAIISLRNLLVPFGIFLATGAAIVFIKNKKLAAVFIFFLAFVHIFLFVGKFFSFSEKKFLFPEVPVLSYVQKNQGFMRSWAVGDAYLENNFATYYGIYYPEGYNSLYIFSYGQFTSAVKGSSFEDLMFRADAGIGRDKVDMLFPNSGRRKLVDILGVGLVIGKNEDARKLETEGFEKVFTDGSFGVFKNNRAYPRAFLASGYKKAAGRKETISVLLDENFDLRNNLVLEKDIQIRPSDGEGRAEIVSYRPEEVIIKTSAKVPKLLFLSDNFYPGWKATVDGKDEEILKADYTFRAVPLGEGDHIVRFYFDSDSFKLGLLISAVGLGVLLIIAFAPKHPKYL